MSAVSELLADDSPAGPAGEAVKVRVALAVVGAERSVVEELIKAKSSEISMMLPALAGILGFPRGTRITSFSMEVVE